MEKLANKIADTIAQNLGYDVEKTAVMAYGLAAMFQMVTIFIFTSIVGIIGGFWPECMIIFLSVGLLRKATGGAHSEAFTGCLFISIFTICFMAFLARYLFNNVDLLIISIFYMIVFITALIVTYRKAPIDTPKKPIKNPVKIKRLRRNAFLTITIYFIAVCILAYFSLEQPRLLNLATSFAFATLWQTFMLTKTGTTLIGIVDRKFQYD
jgi:accessory gene regulator B